MHTRSCVWLPFVVLSIGLSDFFAAAVPLDSQPEEDTNLHLTILHNNDMHAHFEQSDRFTGTCLLEDAKANKCYGGFARILTVVKQYRKDAENGGPAVLYLNSGDTYTGTPWFNMFKHKVAADFMNALMPDAMSLGNHEFDLGVEGLVPFLDDVKFPVVISNLNNAADHPLWKTSSLKKSLVFDVKGFKIGIIGYLTPETKDLVAKSDVEFLDEIESVNKEAEIMKSNGIHIIIAMGHSGIEVGTKVAKSCPLIDVVVGGHSHTMLYTGEQPDIEKVEGPYPTVVTQPSGKKVPVVQTYSYAKYLGILKLVFNKEGDLIEFGGNPILLDSSIPQDPEVLALEDIYRPKVEAIMGKVYGISKVHLDGSNCRFAECNIGNLITDAFVFSRISQYDGSDMTDAPIAFIGSGDIRASAKVGQLTRLDVETIIPFENHLVAVNVTGKALIQMLEYSVHRYSESVGRGEFLQMSGVRVVYDLSKEPNNRVQSVSVLCSHCKVPIYEPLDPNQKYGIIITSYVHEGGDGYTMFKEFEAKSMDATVMGSVEEYIQQSGIVYPAIEGRITIHK